MSYDSLINALLEEGRTKREAILREAQIEAERLMRDAKRACETLDHEAEVILRRDLSARRTALLSRAALSGRQILLQAKQEILETVWRRATQKALALAGNGRAQVLHALLAETLAASSTQSPRALIDERERPFLDGLLKARGIAVEARRQDELLLGIKLEANGEVFTNSFSGRLAKAKPKLTMELSRLLFAESGQPSAISNQSSANS